VKLNATGTVLWSSYLGGAGNDAAYAIATDGNGSAWVTGDTASSGWASGGFDTTFGGNYDAFVAKFSSDGAVPWSTYLGAIGNDNARGVAIDSHNNGYVVGEAGGPGWTSGGFDTTYNGSGDGFIAKITSTGTLSWSSYIGGSDIDGAAGVSVDSSGNAWVVGNTRSSGWTAGASDTTQNGGQDGFITTINSAGTVRWSGYLGGSSADAAYAVAIDSAGTAWVVGGTFSTDWASGGFDVTHNGGYDAYVARVSATGVTRWTSYLGGTTDDNAFAVAISSTSTTWVVGETAAPGANWTSGGFDTTLNGTHDAFIATIADYPILTVSSSDLDAAFGQAVTFTATFSNTYISPTQLMYFYDGNTPLGPAPINGSGQATMTFSYLQPGAHNITARYPGDSGISAIDSSEIIQTIAAAPSAGTQVARYRLYSPVTMEHLYTINATEYNYLGTIGWNQEGVTCAIYDGPANIDSTPTTPLFRLYDTSTRQHLWTTDANEYNTLRLFPHWNDEGVDGYVFASTVTGAVPLYRLNYPDPALNLHLWTSDSFEYGYLPNVGWVQEGVSAYVLSGLSHLPAPTFAASDLWTSDATTASPAATARTTSGFLRAALKT